MSSGSCLPGQHLIEHPRWAEVVKALGYVEAGWWTTYGDLATLTGLSAQSVGRFLGTEKVNNAHRVLRSNGTIAPDFHWIDPDRSDDPRQVLESEGLRFDESGRADPDQRITAEDLRDQRAEPGTDEETGSPTRRAWLVRGSSVDGHDLIPVWLQKGSASLAAASLREIDPPVPLATLKTAVEQDYQHKSYAVREGKVAEFDAFCNRMRVDDYLLTTSQGKTYLGRIAGGSHLHPLLRSAIQPAAKGRVVEHHPARAVREPSPAAAGETAQPG